MKDFAAPIEFGMTVDWTSSGVNPGVIIEDTQPALISFRQVLSDPGKLFLRGNGESIESRFLLPAWGRFK